MPFPVIPVVLAAAGVGLAWKAAGKKKGMTPERKKVFEAAMKSLKDPVKLRSLADAFDKEGLKAEANELRKRAAIFSAPPKVLEARKQVFKKAMKSTKPEAIKQVAKEFHKTGHYEAASKLRKYANGLPTFLKGKVGVKIGEDDTFEGENVPQSIAEV